MLYSLSPRRDLTLTQRLLAIAALTALTAIGARITIPLEPVPCTFQVLAVLLAGMLLGARDGALMGESPDPLITIAASLFEGE